MVVELRQPNENANDRLSTMFVLGKLRRVRERPKATFKDNEPFRGTSA